jgi:triphosphatase
MSDQPREIELKLEASPAEMARVKRAFVASKAPRSTSPPERLESVYYDTDELDLRRAGIELRVRRTGGEHIQTIKRSERRDAGFFDRPELEQAIAGSRPDLGALKKLHLGGALNKKVREAAKPMVRTAVTRAAYRLGNGTARVNLAFDRGYVTARRRRLPINEIELELERGNPAQLFKTARRFQNIAPLRLGIESKAERGFGLLDHGSGQPLKGNKLKLDRASTAGEAFRAIGQDCLRQLTANEPVLQDGDFEALHQMRVALRRLRAAISLFAAVVADRKTERIKSELRWITGELAPAREVDVFLSGVGARSGANAKRSEVGKALDSFRAELGRRRGQALERAQHAARSLRFRKLVLDVAEWLTIGSWTRSRRHRDRPNSSIVAYSRDELARRRRKIRKRGIKLRQLSSMQRHKLRIAIKKLRYATDFFAALFPSKKAKRRSKAFAAALKDLQDALGKLNDIAAHETIGIEVARTHAQERGPALGRRRAFAAGLTIGRERSEVEGLMDGAARAHEAFAGVRPFWK